MAIAILYAEGLKEYDFGPGHPFRGDRYEAFPTFLRMNLAEDDNYKILTAEPATEQDLLLICRKDYIEFTRDYFTAANLGLARVADFEFARFHSLDNLPRGRPGKLEQAARLMIGQAKMSVDIVQAHSYEVVVCIGGNMHHARPHYGEGFCLYNDNAFAAKYLMDRYGLDRILVLDTDAHYGNGTSEYFYADPRVLFVDLHQDPRTLYPGTGFVNEVGEGTGKGYTINIPLPQYAGLDSYRLVFEEIVEPVADEFKPQMIIRNGGSDPHFADGLTNLGLPVAGFTMIGAKVRHIAQALRSPHIHMIGSGYNKEVLPYAWLALISGAAGLPLALKDPFPIPQRFETDLVLEDTKGVVKAVRTCHRDYWESLQ